MKIKRRGGGGLAQEASFPQGTEFESLPQPGPFLLQPCNCLGPRKHRSSGLITSILGLRVVRLGWLGLNSGFFHFGIFAFGDLS